MDAPSPLRLWRRFFPAFDAIHGAIKGLEAKDELGCASWVLQRAKAEFAKTLRDAPWNDEDYCRILDDLMCQYLVTLKTVPVTPSRLASTNLANAVGVLLEHQSEKIRDLARQVISQWSKSVERSDLDEARSRVEELVKLLSDDLGAKREDPAKISAPLPKKSAPVVGTGRDSMAMMVKMEATKRKLREGYQEAADAKRQRKIVVIEPPKMAAQQQRKMQAKGATPNMVEKRQRKVHPIIRERNQARCAASTAVRRPLMTSLCRI